MKISHLDTLQLKFSDTHRIISSMSRGVPVWPDRDYDTFAQKGYIENVIVHKCINMIAKAVAKIQLEVFVNEEKAEEDHPLVVLLNNPSPYYGYQSFMRQVVSHWIIAGNAYVESLPNGKENPNELNVITPSAMKIIPSEFGVGGYQFSWNGQNKEWTDTIKFTAATNQMSVQSDIMHIKLFHPTDPWYGLSGIEAVLFSVEQHNLSGEWNKNLLSNGGRPSGAMVAKNEDNQPLSDEQYNRLKNEINVDIAGAANAGKIMLLEGGLEWQEMSMNPKDMDWNAGRNATSRDIAMGLGVPPVLLGIQGDTTFRNMEEARLEFFDNTVEPMIDEIVSELNAWLSPKFGDDVKIQVDKDSIGALAPRRQMQRQNALEAFREGIQDINETREQIQMEEREEEEASQLFLNAMKIPAGAGAGVSFDDVT